MKKKSLSLSLTHRPLRYRLYFTAITLFDQGDITVAQRRKMSFSSYFLRLCPL